MASEGAATAMLVGYARVSTDDGRQSTLRQLDELRAAGCAEVLEEHASGADRARPVLGRLLAGLEPGTTVCVVKLDQLARSTRDLLDIVDTIGRAGAHLRVLGDPIDTATPVGRFFLTLLGAFAEFELAALRERTRSGLRAARARGRVGGNPGLRERDPDAIRRLAEARRDSHRAGLVAGAFAWLPRVRRLRAAGRSWEEVARALNAGLAAEAPRWTTERLVRSVRALAAEGLAEATLLKPAPKDPPAHNLVDVVAGIAGAAPRPTAASSPPLCCWPGRQTRRRLGAGAKKSRRGSAGRGVAPSRVVGREGPSGGDVQGIA